MIVISINQLIIKVNHLAPCSSVAMLRLTYRNIVVEAEKIALRIEVEGDSYKKGIWEWNVEIIIMEQQEKAKLHLEEKSGY